jgi:hypothetical protein
MTAYARRWTTDSQSAKGVWPCLLDRVNLAEIAYAGFRGDHLRDAAELSQQDPPHIWSWGRWGEVNE